MTERPNIVDARSLDAATQKLLRPAEILADRTGCRHALPRFFYEIPTWEDAKKLRISAHFTFAEMMSVDSREADLLLNTFPHYVPCTVSIFAHYLQAFRDKVDAPVFIATNGGYRSPAHAHSREGSLHLWATAANIYRIGDTFLDDEKSIEKYARVAESIAPEIRAKPFGHGADESDDHLHLDIGYVIYVPRECDEAL